MPTKNPRLTITLNDELAWQLRKLSELTGQSQSRLIASLLEGSDKVLWRIITVLEGAEKAKRSLPGHVTGVMREAQERIESRLGIVATLDEAQASYSKTKSTRRTAGDGEPATGRPAAAAAPLSNRGVRWKAEKPKKSTGSRG
jgi:predicted transcriptional regulator